MSTEQKNRDLILDMYPDYEFMFADGFDDAILGVSERFGSEPIVCYDKSKVLSKLQSEGMTYEEAVEYYEFNIIGAYVGEKTPEFIDTIQSWDKEEE